jgi:hypothetical protein
VVCGVCVRCVCVCGVCVWCVCGVCVLCGVCCVCALCVCVWCVYVCVCVSVCVCVCVLWMSTSTFSYQWSTEGYRGVLVTVRLCQDVKCCIRKVKTLWLRSPKSAVSTMFYSNANHVFFHCSEAATLVRMVQTRTKELWPTVQCTATMYCNNILQQCTATMYCNNVYWTLNYTLSVISQLNHI